jgi:hypothetical protein
MTEILDHFGVTYETVTDAWLWKRGRRPQQMTKKGWDDEGLFYIRCKKDAAFKRYSEWAADQLLETVRQSVICS